MKSRNYGLQPFKLLDDILQVESAMGVLISNFSVIKNSISESSGKNPSGTIKKNATITGIGSMIMSLSILEARLKGLRNFLNSDGSLPLTPQPDSLASTKTPSSTTQKKAASKKKRSWRSGSSSTLGPTWSTRGWNPTTTRRGRYMGSCS